jgi:hypothetical protein
MYRLRLHGVTASVAAQVNFLSVHGRGVHGQWYVRMTARCAAIAQVPLLPQVFQAGKDIAIEVGVAQWQTLVRARCLARKQLLAGTRNADMQPGPSPVSRGSSSTPRYRNCVSVGH